MTKKNSIHIFSKPLQTNDRMWRKTRSPNTGGCFGTDANRFYPFAIPDMNGCRNWGFHWNTGGSSSNPCADTYMGSEAFSEVENRNVRDFLLANKDQIKFYNNLHSYRSLQHCMYIPFEQNVVKLVNLGGF